MTFNIFELLKRAQEGDREAAGRSLLLALLLIFPGIFSKGFAL